MPRVTVIIPTYQWSSVLPYSIGSVLRQAFADFELLVIGDGCADETESVVASVADGRTRWINLPSNTGHQTGPNNEGLRQARGEIVAYLGQDDLWLPHHLSLLVAAIDAGADLAYSLAAMIAPGRAATTFAPAELDELLPGEWVPPTVVAHRRAAAVQVGGWRPYEQVWTDPEADLWERIQNAGFRRHFVRRLTAIKFPALWRKDAYKLKRCDEQAAWSARIAAEPDLEAIELAKMLLPVCEQQRARRRFHEVWREFRTDLWLRLRRRLVSLRVMGRFDRAKDLRNRRRFKGVANGPK